MTPETLALLVALPLAAPVQLSLHEFSHAAAAKIVYPGATVRVEYLPKESGRFGYTYYDGIRRDSPARSAVVLLAPTITDLTVLAVTGVWKHNVSRGTALHGVLTALHWWAAADLTYNWTVGAFRPGSDAYTVLHWQEISH